MSNYWIVQLVLPLAVVAVVLVVTVAAFRGRDRFRRVRAGDIQVFALVAGLGFEGLVRDTTGLRGSPRQWGVHASGSVMVLPGRACEWLEQLFTDRRFTPLDGPEVDGGWSRMGVSRNGRRLLSTAGVVEAAADRLVSRRHARAVAAADAVDRAA